jgi:hypothetical protein
MLCTTGSDLYSEELIIIRTNYHQGCFQDDLSDCRDPTVLIERALTAELLSHFSFRDQKVLASFSFARTQGLKNTHQENFDEADAAFSQAAKIIQDSQSSHECTLLCESFLGQSQSYLDYRRSDFNNACRRIMEAIRNDVILENQYGYQSLFLHRIHLVHNLVRIYVQKGKLQDAIQLSCEVLNYLSGFSNNISVHSDWEWRYLSYQPHEYIAVLFHELVNELAIILVGQEQPIQKSLFADISQALHLEASQKKFSHELRNWLSIKKSFIDREIGTFLLLVSDYISHQKAENLILWYTITIDLLTICQEINSQSAHLLKVKILQSSLNSRFTDKIPRKLCYLLEHYNDQNHFRQGYVENSS